MLVEVESDSEGSTTIACDHVVAADGATGGVRELCGIELAGRANLQHFMSVHFTCLGLAELLEERTLPPACCDADLEP